MELINKLRKRVEREKKELKKDREYAEELISENPGSRRIGYKLSKGGMFSVLLKVGTPILLLLLVYRFLGVHVLAAIIYLSIGVLTAKASDYSKNDWRFYFTVVLYLPVVFYGLLPDKLRVDK